MRPWLLVAGAAYAAVGATFTSHSLPALIAVLVPGIAALVAVLVFRRPRPVSGSAGASAVWTDERAQARQRRAGEEGRRRVARERSEPTNTVSGSDAASARKRLGPSDTVIAQVATGHRAWLVWAVCFAAWELLALLFGELSFSLLMDPVLEIYPLRVAGWALWLSAGWLLVRR
ncbi:hypothetical protein [Actinophytocola sp.]|uniref:hypothetical protein n=1 Tax=Actinophytocola sp. TaxID=1872138 RepID=UPI003D6A9D12